MPSSYIFADIDLTCDPNMEQKILHIMHLDKFISPFIDFMEKNFDGIDNHTFTIVGVDCRYPVRSRSNTFFFPELGKVSVELKLVMEMHKAEKIILHGLFNPKLLRLLAIQPWLLEKCYWVIWGGDLYDYKSQDRSLRRYKLDFLFGRIIRRVGHFVTYIEGDFELAKKWGATGQHHECLMYPSNLYKEYTCAPKSGTELNVLVGNSATSTNNHMEIFEKISASKNKDVMIYCPLSYGEQHYAEVVARKGYELFGSRFVPLMDFMPFENYLELLGKIDIAVFAHRRQQAMGNTITLLGLGKKVFMRNDVTPWQVFKRLGVGVFDLDQFDLNPLDDIEAKHNRKIIAEYFSEKKLIEQYASIFG